MIVKYEPKYKDIWNDLVKHSVNGTFLFNRDYMDYHRDRFEDHSLMAYTQDYGRITALFPACQLGDDIISHRGLTYGGLLWEKLGQAKVSVILKEIVEHYCSMGMQSMIYKAIPAIYHKRPAEADLYALHQLGATLTRRDSTTVIDYRHPIIYDSKRIRICNTRRLTTEVEQSDRWERFWPVLEENLQIRHGKKPIHTMEEMRLLASRFPDNIKLYTSFCKGELVGGCVMYETDMVAHMQYSAQSELGRKFHATEQIYDHIIQHYKDKVRYFDFGISTEWDGDHSVLNEGLTRFKEEYGGTTAVCDFYEINLRGY